MNTSTTSLMDMTNQELNPILMRALRRFRAILPVEIDVYVDLSNESPRIRAEAQSLEDLIMSACILAWQSMCGGTTPIVVEMQVVLLDEVVLDASAQKLKGGIPPRNYAWLTVSNARRTPVSDFHAKMQKPTEVDDRPSSARRLKLSEMHRITHRHQGTITAMPEADCGTAFDIYLPTALPLDVPMVTESGDEVRHILYVDDYEAMRALVDEILPDAGFHVTSLDSGSKALASVKEGLVHYDAVVTDYKLMDGSGIDLLRQIKRIKPDLPVIIISGYVDDALISRANECGAATVMSKASDLSELCSELRLLLGQQMIPTNVSYTDWAGL